jgi:hypothetical protein
MEDLKEAEWKRQIAWAYGAGGCGTAESHGMIARKLNFIKK